MKTKKVKKIRFNIARSLVFVLLIYIIVCLCLFVYNEPVRRIEITGTNYLKDADIIRKAGIKDYPSFVSINNKKIASKIETLDFVQKAKVSYGFDFTIKIDITENRPLFVLKSDNTICLQDGTFIENDNSFVGIPTLLNYTPEDILKVFAKGMGTVDEGILSLINEIEYDPSYSEDGKSIEEQRFLLTMNDSNSVYLLANSVKMLNHYLDIISSDRVSNSGKGTIYLDNKDAVGILFKEYGNGNG